MCNCSKTSPCNNCCAGVQCGCPPDYDVTALPTACKCCPPGYIYSDPTFTYPSGICTNSTGGLTDPIDCTSCEEGMSTDCVIYSGNTSICGVINKGDNLTAMLIKLCPGSEASALLLLQTIGLSTVLMDAFCGLVSLCTGTSGSGSVIIGGIVITYP